MVKCEILKDELKGIITLAFESSNDEGLEVVDAIRVAMMGDFEKRAGYINSKRLIVEVKSGEIKELGQ